MKRTTTWLLTLMVFSLTAMVWAGPVFEERYRRLPLRDREIFSEMGILSRDQLLRLEKAISPESLRALTEEILAQGKLAVSARDASRIREAEARYEASGDLNDARVGIHRYLYDKVHGELGLDYVTSIRGDAVVPVQVDNRLIDALNEPGGSRLVVGGKTWKVTPLWPNGAMPSLAPLGGLTGPLLYVGRGDPEDLDGKDLRGSIALMRFEAGRSYERLFNLGVQAVIVLEDNRVNRESAEGLYHNTPVPAPRFYLPQSRFVVDGQNLVESVQQAMAEGKPLEGALHGGHVFERRPFESMFFYLPPTEGGRPYRIHSDELARLIARSNGISLQKLVDENPGVDLTTLKAGDKLQLGGGKEYEVAKSDLILRLAQRFKLDAPYALLAANGLTQGEGDAEQINVNGTWQPIGQVFKGGNPRQQPKLEMDVFLPEGEIRIPVLEETVVIQLPIDAVSVMPDEDHGAQVAANLALLIRTLEHLTATGPDGKPLVYRRKGVVVALLDAEHIGGQTSRTMAEYIMLNERRPPATSFPIFGVILGSLIGLGLGGFIGFVLAGGNPDTPKPAKQRILPTIITAVGIGVVAAFISIVPWIRGGEIAGQVSDSDRLAYYEQTADWLETGDTGKLTEDGAEWLAEDWLMRRLEAARTALAEESAELGRKQGEGLNENRFKKGSKEYNELEEQIRKLESKTTDIADLRDRTLLNTSLPYPQRVEALWNEIKELKQQGKLWNPLLDHEHLRIRLLDEYSQERNEDEYRKHNLVAVRKLIKTIHPAIGKNLPDPEANVEEGAYDLRLSDSTLKPALGWQLAVSDGSFSLGIEGSDAFRLQYPANKLSNSLQTQYRDVVAFAAHQAGWQDWLFLTQTDKAEYPIATVEPLMNYADLWAAAKVGLLPMRTHNEQYAHLDTPWDTPEHFDFEQFAEQAKVAATLLILGVESPTYSLPPSDLSEQEIARITGRIVRFNARSGIDAQETVENVLIYYPSLKKQAWGPGNSNTAGMVGARMGCYDITRLNGEYMVAAETVGFFKKSLPVVYAYRVNRETGLFDMVTEESNIGTKQQSPKFQLVNNEDTDKEIVVTSIYPWVFMPGPDPMDYQSIGSLRAGHTLRVTDAVLGGSPAHWGLDNPDSKYNEENVLSNIVYAEPGRRVRITDQQGASYRLLLNGEIITPEMARERTTPTNKVDPMPKGEGYLIGPKDGDRNVFQFMTTLHAAEDMLGIVQSKKEQFQKRNLEDKSVEEGAQRSAEKLQSAKEAAEEGQWSLATGFARESWGMSVKNLPRVLQLGREAILSAIILMALLVPASYFVERLLVGSKTIINKLIGTTIIFSIAVVFLQFTHPALLIAVSPLIVLISFVMILMATIVLGLSYQRFEVLVRRARMSAGEVESEEISLAGSLATALSLGVSNLKKRPARTFLTAMTVSILTFSIISFVSVSGSDALATQSVELDALIEGHAVEDGPLEPKYKGMLFRNYHWQGLDESLVNSLQDEYGQRFPVTVRGFYIEQEGGNNAQREGVNQIPLRRLPQKYVVQAGDTWESIAEKFGLRDSKELQNLNKPAVQAIDGDDETATGPTEGKEITVPFPKRPVIITAVMGFQPNETEFSHLNETVTNHQWFRGPRDGLEADRDVIIIPNRAAEAFGIRLQDIYKGTAEQIAAGQAQLKPVDQLPRILMLNKAWRVIGIMDSDQADRYRGINGKSLAIVDYINSGFGANTAGELATEGNSTHLSWDRLVTIPMAGSTRVAKFKPRSVAINLSDASATEIDRLKRDIELRVNRTMFGNFDGQLAMYTTEKQSSVAGLAQIIVPVLLCILIVLNTMMGAVDERKGEVSMLGAIGLSPNQISFLLLSESLVFSVLGIVCGTLVGLAFAALIPALQTYLSIELLTALSFNFTSVLAMLLAMTTGLVVLLATLIPARRAASLAAPSGMAKWELPQPDENGHIDFELPFTLTRGNAVGMIAFFRQFLYNHTDATSEGFNCRNIAHHLLNNQEQALQITCDMWLAPYDLDVAQALEMKVVPTEDEGVFHVRLKLERHSGTEEAWLRTNYGFLNLVRQQFLLWRNLDDDSRAKYVENGVSLFKEDAA